MSESSHSGNLDDLRNPRAKQLIVALSLILFFSFGMPALMIPTLFPVIVEATGWSRAEIFYFASYKFALGGLAAIPAGLGVARFGARRVLIGVTLMQSTLMIAFPVFPYLLNYYLLGATLGASAVVIAISIKSLVSQIFSSIQGRAMGLAFLGSGFGATASPIAAEFMSTFLGWDTVIAVFGCLILCIAFPLSLLALGDVEKHVRNSNVKREIVWDQLKSRNGITFTRIHLAIMSSMFLTGIADQAVRQPIKIFLQTDLGYSGVFAASMLSLIVVISLPARLLFGWLFDYKTNLGFGLCFSLIGVGAFAALMLHEEGVLPFFVLLRGLTNGGLIIVVPLLCTKLLPTRNVALQIAILTAIYGAGMAIGPIMASYFFESYSSYRPAFVICCFLQVVALLCFLYGAAQHSRMAKVERSGG